MIANPEAFAIQRKMKFASAVDSTMTRHGRVRKSKINGMCYLVIFLLRSFYNNAVFQ